MADDIIPQEVLYAARWWRDQLVLSPLVSVDIATRFEQVFVENFWKEKLAAGQHGWFPQKPLRAQAFRYGYF
jgi:hypothetical protein